VPDDRVDKVRGRLDAVLVASRVAPTTSRIGLVPVATTTHTEPFHISKAIATLDYVSAGRAGVQVRVSGSAVEAQQFGRRTIPDPTGGDLLDEAADFVEVMRRLWDSWEDDAEIRDAATGDSHDVLTAGAPQQRGRERSPDPGRTGDSGRTTIVGQRDRASVAKSVERNVV